MVFEKAKAMTVISYSESTAADMVERIQENIDAFRNGMAERIDEESLREYSDKISEMTDIMVSKDGRNEFAGEARQFREHVGKVRAFMETDKDPADARYLGKNAISAFFAGIADSLGIGKDKPAKNSKAK